MKPYIMKYSQKVELSSPSVSCARTDTTVQTFTIENQDQDRDAVCLEWTMQTNTTEPTDNDSLYFLDETAITRTLETTDQDQLHFGTTLLTESIEVVDPDEILLTH